MGARAVQSRVRTVKLQGRFLCDCYACGEPIAITEENSVGAGLFHGVGAQGLGPNGETGCAVFDAVRSLDDATEFLKKCREAIEQKDKS